MFYLHRAILAAVLLVSLSMDTLAENLATKSSPANGAKTGGLAPPIAKRIPKEISTHGDSRLDDYFWLRDKTNAEVMAYLEAENAYAEAVMQPLQNFRETLYREILSHLKETDASAPVRRGEFLYYTRTEEGKNYTIHCRKHGSLTPSRCQSSRSGERRGGDSRRAERLHLRELDRS